MKARYLRQLLNNTGYQVANEEGNIVIGSPMCHDLISVEKSTLRLRFALDSERKGRAAIGQDSESTIELTFIWDKLAELIASGEIIDIMDGRDEIEKQIPVFAVKDGKLICEQTDSYDVRSNGILNTTSNGDPLYRNVWFLTKQEAIEQAIESYESYVAAGQDIIAQQQNRLKDQKVVLARNKKWLNKLKKLHQKGP